MNEVHDPYGSCETDCTHDLARGCSAKDLHDSDGPYPDVSELVPAGWLGDAIMAASNRQTADQTVT